MICEDKETAHHTLHRFMIERIYGDAGIKVVIEEFLQGFEASIIAFWNGEKAFPCVSAKDYKKVGNGNTGANWWNGNCSSKSRIYGRAFSRF